MASGPSRRLRRLTARAAILLLALAALAPPGAAQGREAGLRRVRGLVAEIRAAGGRSGVVVLDGETGRTLVDAGGGDPLIPASNQKILTVAAALRHLGPEARFRTVLNAAGTVEDGVLRGALILGGDGDPSFEGPEGAGGGTGGDVAAFVAAVLAAGIRSVDGDLLVDDGVFDREFTHRAWPRDDPAKRYLAEVSALSFRGNAIELIVRPGRAPGARPDVRCGTPGAPIDLDVRAVTDAVKSRHAVAISRPRDANRFSVSGRVWTGAAPSPLAAAIHDPPLVLGGILKAALEEAGCRIAGTVRRPGPAEALPAAMTNLAWRETELAALLPAILARSDNHYAETLFKATGARRQGTGTFATGANAVLEALVAGGMTAEGIVVSDGSGLSRDNRVQARVVARLLLDAWRDGGPSHPLIASLAVAGRSGTLAQRMREAGGRVRGKTGTLRGVTALSAIVTPASGGMFIVAMLSNGTTRPVRSFHDRVCLELARIGAP